VADLIHPEEVAREFKTRFGRAGRLHRAPGRVNLIGEHTDYNDGFVLPMALDRSTWVAAAPRGDRAIVVRSRELDEEDVFDLDDSLPRPQGRWSDYVRGVATILDRGPERAALQEPPACQSGVARPFQGRVCGADLLIASDVPIGAGVSSSAALEVACAGALLDLAGGTMDPTPIARACQRAEHEFVGIRCGIMDQMIACHGRAGHALLLDTRSLERTFVPLPDSIRVLVCNTMVRHELASGEYNRRRADCELGVAALRRAVPVIRALRDATLEQLDAVRADLPDPVYARCRHVITENNRVGRAADALMREDFSECGALMAASHASLRDDYDVSCRELDVMADIVADCDGVFGARMTGGGFGGCVVAIVEASRASDDLLQSIRGQYEANVGRRPDVWITAAGAGASAWSPAHV